MFIGVGLMEYTQIGPGLNPDAWSWTYFPAFVHMNLDWSSDAFNVGEEVTWSLGCKSDESIPIGGIYLSTTNANPANTLHYGTWTRVAQGEYLVGEL